MRWVKVLLCLGLSFSACGLQAQTDSSSISGQPYSFDEYMENVLLYHPVVRQAQTLGRQAQQELRLARGYLDPVLKSDFNLKEFDGKTYYNTWDTKLEIPVWFNTDLNVGLERNRGQYLNEQLSNTEEGLIYAGITVPVGRGLLMDDRRSAILQARELQGMTEAEQIKEINKILLKAAKAYWDWYYAYESLQIISTVEELAEVRYQNIVQQVINGDIAPIDSLKAFINYQERYVQQQQAVLAYENAGIQFSNFLWTEQDEMPVPLEPLVDTYPVMKSYGDSLLQPQTLRALKQLAMQRHPELLKLQFKNNQLEIAQRLYREFLKPEINLKYNFLTKPARLFSDNGNGMGEFTYFDNNYKLGIEFYFPLFLRKERAKLAINQIKLEQNYYETSFQRTQIANEIDTTYNSLTTLGRMLEVQTNMTENYQALLQGEIFKFQNGESSVFLINTRETELLNARIKLLKMQTQYQKVVLELLYAAGVQMLQWNEDE